MFNRNKVSNIDIKNHLLLSLEYNSAALDYVQDKIKHHEDWLKFMERDGTIKNELSVLKYIEFTLKYLDDCYNESLKECGGIHD